MAGLTQLELSLKQQNDALNNRIEQVMEQGAYKLQDSSMTRSIPTEMSHGENTNALGSEIRSLIDQIDN